MKKDKVVSMILAFYVFMQILEKFKKRKFGKSFYLQNCLQIFKNF